MISMLLNILINLKSPLDQFGGDSLWPWLWQPIYNTIIERIDVIDAIDLTNMDIMHGIIVGFLSTYFFSDDDAEGTEWEDNEVGIANNQSIVLFSNALGMVPGIETSTSEAALTFFISFSTVAGCMLLGFTLHSARYFSALLPSGTPFLIMPFILLIELVSYLARAISLGMRLFANMFAGHSLSKILFTFAWIALMSAMPIPGFFIIALMLVIALMELGIAYLQSYVLGALSFMYYEEVVNPAH